MLELNQLDDLVNRFIVGNNVRKVISVSDECNTASGSTMGLIKMLAFEES